MLYDRGKPEMYIRNHADDERIGDAGIGEKRCTVVEDEIDTSELL